MCPALQKKSSSCTSTTPHTVDPNVTSPQDHGTLPQAQAQAQLISKDGATVTTTLRAQDPFAQPYNPNLHIGDLKDEDETTEYAVLVSDDR